MSNYIEQVYNWVVKKNPGQVEFHQAVNEVFDSLQIVDELAVHYHNKKF